MGPGLATIGEERAKGPRVADGLRPSGCWNEKAELGIGREHEEAIDTDVRGELLRDARARGDGCERDRESKRRQLARHRSTRATRRRRPCSCGSRRTGPLHARSARACCTRGSSQSVPSSRARASSSSPKASPIRRRVATQSKKSAVFGFDAPERAHRGLRRTLGRLDGGRRVGLHDVNLRMERHRGGARHGALRVDRQRHAQPMTTAGVDAEDVVQEERQRRGSVERLPRLLRMMLERICGGLAVEADERRAADLGDTHRRSRWQPAVPDADADRLLRQNLERHRRVAEGLRAVKDLRAAKLRVVACAAAEELILARGRERQLVDEIVGVSGERVGHHERGAMWMGRHRRAAKRLGDLLRRPLAVGPDAVTDARREQEIVRLQGERAREARRRASRT